MFDPKTLDQEITEHHGLVPETWAAVREPFLKLLRACSTAIENDGKILLFGNGGSAADAQHLATELVVRYSRDRKPIPALALTTDTSLLTAGANDLGFEAVFARQIEALGCANDVGIAISTSGASPNVISGVRAAQKLGMTIAGFTGGSGGELAGMADPVLIVPSRKTARIQEMHILLGHMLCFGLEKSLGYMD